MCIKSRTTNLTYKDSLTFETNEMGRACGAYGGGERGAQGVGSETFERGHWGDPDVDGRIILRWMFSSWRGSWGLYGVG
jgi:hypothetical protein